jgi:hypothetical protein
VAIAIVIGLMVFALLFLGQRVIQLIIGLVRLIFLLLAEGAYSIPRALAAVLLTTLLAWGAISIAGGWRTYSEQQARLE